MNQMQPYTTNYTNNQQYLAQAPPPNQQPPYPPTPQMQAPPLFTGQPPFPPGGNPYSSQPRPFAPMRRCFICNNPGHMANRCPHKIQTPTPPINPNGHPNESAGSPSADSLTEGLTPSETNEVRAFADNVRKRKRPVQISDFKGLAVEIVKELQTQTGRMPMDPVERRNHATSSPNKSHSHQAPRPRSVRQHAPPAPSSNSKSICSKAANKHLTDVFKKSFKSLSGKDLKASLDKADIEWTDNDFRNTIKKNVLIAKLAIFRSQEHIDMMKDASAQ